LRGTKRREQTETKPFPKGDGTIWREAGERGFRIGVCPSTREHGPPRSQVNQKGVRKKGGKVLWKGRVVRQRNLWAGLLSPKFIG